MKSLAVNGIIGEMQRKGATKHCCDRGFRLSRLNVQQIYEVSPGDSLSVRISREFELPRN